MYALQLNQINELLINGSKIGHKQILRDSPYYKLICQRTDDGALFENCRVYATISMPIPGAVQRELLFIDISNIALDNIPRITSIEGFYFRGTSPLQVIAVDMGAALKKEPTMKEAASFFENYRKTMGDFLQNDYCLTESQRLKLTYYAAFVMVYINFNLDKTTFLKLQTYMRSATNRGCTPENHLFERMKELVDTKYNFLDMNMVFLAFERGVREVDEIEFDKVPLESSDVSEAGQVSEMSGAD